MEDPQTRKGAQLIGGSPQPTTPGTTSLLVTVRSGQHSSVMEVGSAEATAMISADIGARGPVTFVAIDGHSAAGKSTLAVALAGQLDGAVIAGDDFYRPMDHKSALASRRARVRPSTTTGCACAVRSWNLSVDASRPPSVPTIGARTR